MKSTYSRTTAAILLALLMLGTLVTGCARNQQELRNGITSIFDTAAVPIKILLRQFDDVSDGNG